MLQHISVKRALALLVMVVATSGCSPSKPPPPQWEARQHVLAVNEKGQAVDPNTWHDSLADGVDEQLDDMFAAMNAWHEQRGDGNADKPRKILIFVHGGLND